MSQQCSTAWSTWHASGIAFERTTAELWDAEEVMDRYLGIGASLEAD